MMQRIEKRPLGGTDWTCTPLGFGGYRIDTGRSEHRTALEAFLAQGGNLVDTSANYGDGASETLIGEVLAADARALVVTKAGYIQGRNKSLALQREFPDIVKFAPDVWHCVHPQFLAAQLELSAGRLKRPRIDCLLLHNPEYFLTDRQQNGTLTPDDREEFYGRIRRAFEFLEEAVEDGRIAAYGVSSNHFAYPEDQPLATNVARCLAVAGEISARHHFRVVQFPLNLYESNAALLPNTEGQTVLEFCRDRGLGVLTNRPLNALLGGRLVRLADGAVPAGVDLDPREHLANLGAHEEEFRTRFDFPLMRAGEGAAPWLKAALLQVDSADEFRAVVRQAFLPAVQTWLTNADRALTGEAAYGKWRRRFTDLLDDVLDTAQNRILRSQAEEAEGIRAQLAEAGLADADAPLSRLALAVLLGLEGISAVLCGMRRPAYVEDAFAALALAPADARQILARFGGVR